MSEAQELRNKAAHARRMADSISDVKPQRGLEDLAREFEAKAADIERQQSRSAEQKPGSQSGTP